MVAYIPFNQVRYALIFCVSYDKTHKRRMGTFFDKIFQSYFCAMSR